MTCVRRGVRPVFIGLSFAIASWSADVHAQPDPRAPAEAPEPEADEGSERPEVAATEQDQPTPAATATEAEDGGTGPDEQPATTAPPKPVIETPSVPPAPPPVEVATPKERNPWLGGFGFFAPGILFGNFGDIDRALEADTAVGEGGAPPHFAVTVGGGGGYLLGGVYMIRGKGFGFFTPSSPTSRGRTTHRGGGGGFDVGLVFFNRHRWWLYPFVGLGGIGTTVTVKNDHDDDIDVGGLTIAPGDRADLTSGYFTFELGFAFQRLMFRKPKPPERAMGGLINGGEVGLLVSLHRSQYQDGDTTLPDMPSARMLGFYVRLLLGGGGVNRWEPPKLGKRRRRRG